MSYTFEGSPAKANLWLPFAVAKQHMMKRNGIQRNTVMPDASTMIMISTNPPHIHIIAGSGQYYFTSRISEERLTGDGERIYIEGDPKGETSSEAKLEIHSPFSRDLDRHVWNGELYSVLGGYGKRYYTPDWPYYAIDGIGIREYALGVSAEVVKDGIVVYKAPFSSWNSFVNNGVVIDLGITGDWKASVIGSDEISSSGSISVNSSHLAVDADFEPELLHFPSRGLSSRTVFKEFSTTDVKPLVYWSINREGTKAMAVVQHIFDAIYLRVKEDGSHFDEEVTSNRWRFNLVPVIVEIAIEVDEDKKVLITEVGRTKYGYAATPDSRLLFADYYYPETEEPEVGAPPVVPAHGDKVLGFISYYSKPFINLEDPPYVDYFYEVTDFVTLSIKVGEEEIIRDTFRENHEYASGNSDPDLPSSQDGKLSAIDLRYVSYAVWCITRTQGGADLGAPLYVTYKGKEVFNSILAKGGDAHQTPENYSPSPPRSYVAPQGNYYGPYWDTGVRPNDALAVNHELDSVAFYTSYSPLSSSPFSWRADLYIFLDKQPDPRDEVYNVIYEFHTKASRAIEPDKGGTDHCIASNWI